MYMFDYFTCYHLESGWHVTRPKQSLSLRRGRDWELGCLHHCAVLMLTLAEVPNYVLQNSHNLSSY